MTVKENDTVTIVPSVALNKLKLSEIAGFKGTIAEAKFNKEGHFLGAWVALKEPYLEETEWWVPAISILVD